jgi:hypothetical protein
MPPVSVLMAVHNGEAYLAEAIQSILNQTFTDFEFIILDDASTDQTPNILKGFARHDHRITLLENPTNLGLTRSLNKGLVICRGDYIARMDADDISLSHRLSEQIAYLDQHPDAVMVTGHYHLIDDQGDLLGTLRRNPDAILVAWGMMFFNYVGGHGQVMFRRQPVLGLGGYNESRRYSQDYELWLRLMSQGKIAIVPRVWSKIRIHNQNVSRQHAAEQEHISLEDSQNAVRQHTGITIDLADLAMLRAFWLEPFPCPSQASLVQHHLQNLSRAFLSRYTDHPAASRQLRHAIGERFIAWTRSVSLRRNPRRKLQLAGYALSWYPLGMLRDIFQIISSRRNLV